MSLPEAAHTANPLSIRLLGSVSFWVADRPWRFAAPPRTLPLLAYLIVHRNTLLPRQSIAYALWPDDEESSARANLRRHLHYLQAALPEAPAGIPWVATNGKALGWNPNAAADIDVVSFERYSANLSTQELGDAIYHGEFFPELFDDWVIAERQRLHEIEINNLVNLIALARSDGELSRAMQLVQRLLTFDPWREDAVRQIMELRYAAGDRAGAIAQYERFATALHDELSVSPMPETIVCRDRIMLDAPVLQPDGSPRTLQVGMQRPILPFAGRENELATLQEWWRDAAGGNGTLGIVSGEAGIGKTRLLSELKELVQCGGGRVLVGATSRLEAFPYQAIVEALGTATAMVRRSAVDPIWTSVLSGVIPALSDEAPPDIGEGSVTSRLFEAMFRVLDALSKQRPALLVLEDLHWAGAATVDLVDYLSSRIATSRLFIVISYRDEEVARTHPLRRLRSRSQHRRAQLALAPLDRLAVATLVEKIRSPLPPDSDWPALLYGRSEGNPLFLAQLIATVLERKSSAPLNDELPADIETAITSRLDRLTTDGRSLALTAAVIGENFDAQLLEDVTAWNSSRISTALGELLDRRLVRDAGLADGADYGFSHHLIEAAAYQQAARHDLTQRHRRVAIVLEQLYPLRLDELAYRIARHFERGAESESAARYYARAARVALRSYAYRDALARATEGLNLTTTSSVRVELLLLREEGFGKTGDAANRESDLNELASLLPTDDMRARCELQRRRVSFLHAADRREDEAAAIEQLKAFAALTQDRGVSAEGSYAGARLLMLSSRYQDALLECQRALGVASGSQDIELQVRCHLLAVDIRERCAEFTEAQTALGRAKLLSSKTQSPGLELAALLMSCRVANWQNRYDDLHVYGTRMLELSTAVGDRSHEGNACNVLGVVAMYAFAPDDALRYFERSVEIFSSLGRPRNVVAACMNQTQLFTRLGRLREAVDIGERAKETAVVARAQLFVESANCYLAEAYLRQGNLHSAWQAASEAVASCQSSGSRNGAPAAMKLAKCEALEGKFELSTVLIERALEALPMPFDVQHAEGRAELARVALQAGRVDSAVGHVTAMLEMLGQRRGGFAEPEFQYLVGAGVLRASGREAEAQTQLEAAWQIYQERLSRLTPQERPPYAALDFHAALEEARLRGRWVLGDVLVKL